MKTFEKNIVSIYGQKGEQWLNKLPVIIAKLTQKYQLHDLVPVNNMSFNYVASGYQQSYPIILKLGLDEEALIKEALCLKAFAHHGAAEVLATEQQMIIMQQAIPGTTLKTYFPKQDEQATQILCAIIKKLHCASIPGQHPFRAISDLLKTLDKALDIPDPILSKARKLRDHLLNSTEQEVLLHGDLHHDNILQNRDEWLVIDPKGFIGDPAFEPIAYLCNPIPELLQETNAQQIINRRVSICAKMLELPEQRIQDCLYVKSVLCWAWNLEDKLDTTYWKEFLKLID